MGARCTQSPISALYGVPRAFMRNHVQVGPSDTQSEMVAVGQAWGGRGGIMCGDTGRRLCGHLQTSAAQRDWAQACQQMWKWLSCCVCSYTFPAGCRTCSSSMVMTWTHYPPRGGGCLVAIEAATPNGGTTTNQNPQFPTFPLPLICRLDISRCKCFHNQECVVCDDSCDADKPVNDFNPLAAVPDCQVE